MEFETVSAVDPTGASVAKNRGSAEQANASGKYAVSCFDKDGKLKWSEDFSNIVTTQGKNDCLDKYLSGSSYNALFYVGLISSTGYTGIPVLADTAASHSTWTEDQNYSQTNRPTAAWSAASAGTKVLSTAAVFTMTAPVTIKGCFLTTSSTKGGTAGVLYSAGLFSGGDKTVGTGDTLNISYTASM